MDPAGNMDPVPATYSWEVDTKAPQTLITTKPSDPSNSANALFEFSCDESLCTFECRLDAGEFGPCGSPKNYASLADSRHTFTVRATDEVGNIDYSNPASCSWTIDSTPPDSFLTSTPNNPTRATDATFVFNCTGGPCTFECKLDAEIWSSCASPQNLTGLLEGLHIFQVRAIDAVQNVDASPASYTWEVDLTPPITSLTSKPWDPSNSDSPEFGFGCNETGCVFQCNLDSGGWPACNSPQAYSGLSEGGHSFQVRAVDAAGNTEASPSSYTWTIDTTAPDTSLTTTPSNPANSSSANFAFNGSEANCTFECQLDSGSWTGCASPAAYTGLPEGNHAFKVRARDLAGNMDASAASFAWTIDLTLPTVFINSYPANPTNSPTASFAFFCSETGCSFECRMDGGVWSGCSSPQSYSSLGDGQHIFQARATDAAGNCSSNPATFIWIVDTLPPVTTITSAPTDPSQSAAATFLFACNDGPCTFQCQLDGGGYSGCASPKTYTGLSETTHTFEVVATDAVGNVEPSPAVYQWTVILFVDTTISYGPSNPTQSQDASFGFSCNKPSCTFECSLDSSPFSACSSPQSYSGLAEGTYNFQVRAWYAGTPDITPASYTWVIDRTPPQTTILSGPSNPSYSPNATFSFSCSETGCTFECMLDSGSWSACPSPKTYTGLTIGSHTFQVRATDAAGNLETSPQSYNWNIPSLQAWTPTSTTNAPAARTNHTAVWTGSEMIIWGGESGSYLNTGGRYNPSTDSWTPTSTGTNVPAGRSYHTAVWTGTEMIIWGGDGGSYTRLNTGARYNPAADSWVAITTTNAPSARWQPTGFWTGSVMLVWGGDSSPLTNSGGQYDPLTNSWTPTSTTNAPVARYNHAGVWTGSQMIIWGGYDGSYLNSGGVYNP